MADGVGAASATGAGMFGGATAGCTGVDFSMPEAGIAAASGEMPAPEDAGGGPTSSWIADSGLAAISRAGAAASFLTMSTT